VISFGTRKFITTVKNVKPPKVFVPPSVLEDMGAIIHLCDDEVGWLGTVEVTEDQDFIITEVFVPKQKVHGATTEIDPEGYTELATQLMQEREDGVDIVNAIRFWGHSHVSMNVGPSDRDQQQLRDLVKDSEDYFIAARGNKQGDLRFDVLYSNGIQVEDVPWEPIRVSNEREEGWKKIIGDKVSKLQETRTVVTSYGHDTIVIGDQGMFDDAWADHYSYPRRSNKQRKRDARQLSMEELEFVNQVCDPEFSPDPADVALCVEMSYQAGVELDAFKPKRLHEAAGDFMDWTGRVRPMVEITNAEAEAAGFEMA